MRDGTPCCYQMKARFNVFRGDFKHANVRHSSDDELRDDLNQKIFALFANMEGDLLYSVMEGCKGNLHDLLTHVGSLGMVEALKIVLEVTKILWNYQLKTGFLHCDWKLENILVTKGANGTTNYMLADFGTSSLDKTYFFMEAGNICTPEYMPLESILNCFNILLPLRWTLGHWPLSSVPWQVAMSSLTMMITWKIFLFLGNWPCLH